MLFRRSGMPIVTTCVLAACVLAGCADDEPLVTADGSATTSAWPWEKYPPDTPSPSPTPSVSPVPSEPPAPTRTPTPSRTTEPSDTPEPTEPPKQSDEPEVTGTEAPSSTPEAPSGRQRLEDEVVSLTNAERSSHGCETPLRIEERLRTAARLHSDDMARRDYMDHTSPEGVGPAQRAEDAGYSAWSGENIAMGYPTAEAVVEGWMSSEGHRANILNCDFRAVGVGAADSDRGVYWTQMFGYE